MKKASGQCLTNCVRISALSKKSRFWRFSILIRQKTLDWPFSAAIWHSAMVFERYERVESRIWKQKMPYCAIKSKGVFAQSPPPLLT